MVSSANPARAGLADDTLAAEAVPWSADPAQGADGSAGSDAPPHPRAGPLGAARGESRRARPSTAGREDNTPCDGADHSGVGRYGVREPWAVSWAGGPALTSGAERLINAGWALLLVTAQAGGDIWKGVRARVLLRQERVVSTQIDPRSTIVTAQLFVHGPLHDAIEAESRGDTAVMSRAEPHGWHHTWQPREIGQTSHICRRAEAFEPASTCIISPPSRPPAQSGAGRPCCQTPEVIPYCLME